MNQFLARCIKSAFNRIGLDIRRSRSGWPDERTLANILRARGVNVVFDVGANIGQYSVALRAAAYAGRIVSFEPLTEAHRLLVEASSADPFWDVAPRCALGSEDGDIEINIARNSVSSSILPMLVSHLSAAPESAYVSSERVPLRRLDDVAFSYLDNHSQAFLKVDTQGYEDRVLSGASRLLPRLVGIQLELSLVPLYDGQQSYTQLIDSLSAMGFEMWAIIPGFADPASGQLLQIDAVMLRRHPSEKP